MSRIKFSHKITSMNIAKTTKLIDYFVEDMTIELSY